MTRSQRCLSTLLLILCSSHAAMAQQASFHYTVAMPYPDSHHFLVTLDCKGLPGTITDLKMPGWMPGYYQLLDYARNVSAFKATATGGKPLGPEGAISC